MLLFFRHCCVTGFFFPLVLICVVSSVYTLFREILVRENWVISYRLYPHLSVGAQKSLKYISVSVLLNNLMKKKKQDRGSG